jgi:hypothetical protein
MFRGPAWISIAAAGAPLFALAMMWRHRQSLGDAETGRPTDGWVSRPSTGGSLPSWTAADRPPR